MGGIVAAMTHAAFVGINDCQPMIGASGAIAAVMGAYLVMYPSSKIRILIFFIYSRYIPAWVFLAIWGGTEIYTSIKGISLINDVGGDTVAHAAHAGGFVYGLFAGWYFRQKYGLQPIA